jgi:hypothetical protein
MFLDLNMKILKSGSSIVPLFALPIRCARYLGRQGMSWSIAEVCMDNLHRNISRNAQHML